MRSRAVRNPLHWDCRPGVSTEIIEGPMKGTKVNSIFEEIPNGTKIMVNAEIKVSFKYKFLEPIIKRKYKIALTSVLYKMNTAIMELE